MPEWMIPIIISTCSGGAMLAILSFFTSGIKRDFERQFDGKIQTMVSQFNVLAETVNKLSIFFESRFVEIQKSLSHIESIEKESTLVRDLFLRHQEEYREAIQRIHTRIDKQQEKE